MNILLILTSHDSLGDSGEKTGFWLEELAAPYYTFIDAGAQVTLTSPKGGLPPLDPKSNQPEFQTAATVRSVPILRQCKRCRLPCPYLQLMWRIMMPFSMPEDMVHCGIWPKIRAQLA